MITERKVVLRPILESSGGVHLTAYLVNRGDLVDLKLQLRKTILEAERYLQGAQGKEEKRKFLDPLRGLLTDTRIFKGLKGNVGIFRTQDSFRILNIPIEMERQCHVASSFHVKPLLRWLQIDHEFLILGLNFDSAHLYLGSQTSLKKVDSILFPELYRFSDADSEYANLKRARHFSLRSENTFLWLNDWLLQATQRSSPRLFLAGEELLLEELCKHLEYKNLVKKPMAISFGDHNLQDICLRVRKVLKDDAVDRLNQTLLEFRVAEDLNIVKKNIFQIAKAAVQGRIQKLLVANGVSLYGRIDRKTGGLALHPFDLDHEDDDILDDLAQTVLASGGEVFVAPKEQIPKCRPALAILQGQASGLEKSSARVERFVGQERSAI